MGRPYHYLGPLIKVVSAEAGSIEIEEGIAQSWAGLSAHRVSRSWFQAAAPAAALAPVASPRLRAARDLTLAESRLLLRYCRTATPDPKAHRVAVAVAVKRLNQRGLQVSFDFTSSHLSSVPLCPHFKFSIQFFVCFRGNLRC
jgi:hypothetical protein